MISLVDLYFSLSYVSVEKLCPHLIFKPLHFVYKNCRHLYIKMLSVPVHGGLLAKQSYLFSKYSIPPFHPFFYYLRLQYAAGEDYPGFVLLLTFLPKDLLYC